MPALFYSHAVHDMILGTGIGRDKNSEGWRKNLHLSIFLFPDGLCKLIYDLNVSDIYLCD